MKNFNPFRLSFDERRRARIGATVISATALVLGLASVSAQLNASSDTVAASTNATPEPEVRMLARKGEDPAGPSCEDQTWPYLEQRCLRPAGAKAAERTTPKHGLGTQAVVLPSASQPAVTPPQAAIPETTGVASPREAAAPAVAAAPPAPQAAGSVPQAVNPAVGTVTVSPAKAMPPLSKWEARRLERQERTRLQRERREQAIRLHRERREQTKRVREERLKARAEARETKRQSGG